MAASRKLKEDLLHDSRSDFRVAWDGGNSGLPLIGLRPDWNARRFDVVKRCKRNANSTAEIKDPTSMIGCLMIKTWTAQQDLSYTACQLIYPVRRGGEFMYDKRLKGYRDKRIIGTKLILFAYDVLGSCTINWPIIISHLPACFLFMFPFFTLLFPGAFSPLARFCVPPAPCGVAPFSPTK